MKSTGFEPGFYFPARLCTHGAIFTKYLNFLSLSFFVSETQIVIAKSKWDNTWGAGGGEETDNLGFIQ